MKKALVLHIGRPKVGSTALQRFLRDNREALLTQGFLYPSSPMFNGASHKLALVFQPELRDAKAVEGLSADEVYATLAAEAAASGARCTVASSENLFLVNPALPGKYLKRDFATRIICYVRRQDEVLVSSLLQEIRDGDVAADVDIDAYASSPDRLRWLDYEAILDAWASVFGADNIIVRVMESGQLNGTIEEDFASVVGASMSGLRQPPGRGNPSPARDVLELMRMLNASPNGSRPRVRQLMDATLLEVSERLGSKGEFDARTLVPSRVRRDILERFQRSNAEVAHKYLGRKDGVLFRDASIREPEAAATYTGLDLERFAATALTLLADQQRQILKLQAQLHALQRQAK